MKTNTIIAIVLVIIVAIGITVFFTTRKNTPKDSESSTSVLINPSIPSTTQTGNQTQATPPNTSTGTTNPSFPQTGFDPK